jgi:hypothetical protein
MSHPPWFRFNRNGLTLSKLAHCYRKLARLPHGNSISSSMSAASIDDDD